MPPKLTRVHKPPNGLSGSPVKSSPGVAPGGQQTVHKCVMCEGVMESKQALQDHFRLHANGTIDMKGRTRVREDSNKKVETVKVVAKSGSKQWISCDVCMERFETVTLAIQHKFRKHPK